MRRLAGWNSRGILQFADMHGDGFDAASWGVTLAAMDAQLHAATDDGRMLVGIDAIAAAYQAVGRGWLVWPLTWRFAHSFWQQSYRWFARNRYLASKLLGYRCVDGVCDVRFR
jgi:predicted DCC family thiol-disulfide oxidoreductase YuxK